MSRQIVDDPTTFFSVADIELSEDEDDAGYNSPDGTYKGVKPRNTAKAQQRSSKLVAVAAISTRSSESVEPDLDSSSERTPSTRRNPTRKIARRAPALNFETLRRSAPRHPRIPPRPTAQPQRLFGLQHAPVYHPTIEEFSNPIAYIERIAPEAKQFGICKIVPPAGWTPPFSVDTETFRFKTRLQQLNSMECSARASINFLEQLHLFHGQHGNGSISIPTIADKPLDMWKLRKEVNALGGYNLVTADRKWTIVAKAMGYDAQLMSSVWSTLKTAYSKLVVPFEHYVNRQTVEDDASPPDLTNFFQSRPIPANTHDNLPNTPKHTSGADSLATPDSDAIHLAKRAMPVELQETVRTASDKLNEALMNSNHTGASAVASTSATPAVDQDQPEEEVPGDVCEICTRDHDPDKIVLCDGCDRGFHLACLSPPLLEVPRSQFYCKVCLLMEGADYGFEEGHEHSLHSFRRRADAFKRNWLEAHPLPIDEGKGPESMREGAELDVMAEQIAIEDHFEREFWRLVESPFEGVEVEYGADVDASKDGGAFPNLELHPNDPYSRDGWNLNNLPILAGSLLRYIKSDISGMTIPWMYVGMCFSTFAWHKEDHYTYSINYHHWGDTKTWYGINGDSDTDLEATMKLAAPELLAQQPDLLFQLVTLMSPGRLKANGVKVVACDQRPREFVITFPRAYHSGFNHGFNFNEAVNFALPDWLPTGLKCVNRYKDIKKNPVFSHDELLVTISLHESSPAQSAWLYPNWKEMVERELASRQRLRIAVPDLTEQVDETEYEEEEYQCNSCRILCYLAQVTVEGSETIACADCHSTLGDGIKSFRLRYSDAELLALLHRIKVRADRHAATLRATTSNNLAATNNRKRKSQLTMSQAPTQRVKVEAANSYV